MRLDKFLKVSRLIKRRTVANDACDAGRVTINDRPAKASANVKVGDIIEIVLAARQCASKSLMLRKQQEKRMRRSCSVTFKKKVLFLSLPS